MNIRNPISVRPWQHVLEPLEGYLCLSENLWKYRSEFTGSWNFGPPDEDAKTVQWIVDRLINLWGDEAHIELDKEKHPYEARYLKLDCSKARNLLGWSPKLNLSTTIEWIVSWYKSYKNNEDMRHITEEEILRYENLKGMNKHE